MKCIILFNNNQLGVKSGVKFNMTMIVVGENESLESAMKRFKRKVQRDGIIGDMRKQEEYVKPSVKRKRKSEAARKRAKKDSKGGF